jgi:hypothetical protein
MEVRDTKPLAGLLGDVLRDLQEIVRSEVRLARAEVKEEAGKAAHAGKLAGMGAVLGVYAGGFFLLAIVRLLDTRLATWLSALVVAVVVGVIGAGLLAAGRKRMKDVKAKPEKTIDSVKENLQWKTSRQR